MEGVEKKMEVKGRVIGSGQPLICVPVMEEGKDAVIKEIITLSQGPADVIEWRIDAFLDYKNYNAVREIFQTVAPYLKEKIFLYTFRTKKQGGYGEIEEDELEDIHDLAAEAGCVDFVDMEFFEEEYPARKIRKLHKKGLKVIASHHDFYETPANEVMQMLLERMCAGNADIVKIAVMPNSMEDVLRLLAVTNTFKNENPDTPIISMSMGKMGMISRLCGESFGSAMTFAAHKKASAPGQMEMSEVKDILDKLHESLAKPVENE